MSDHLKFDIEKIEYYSDNPTKRKVFTASVVLLVSFAFGFIFFILFISFFTTPKQKDLAYKVKIYQDVLQQSSSQYELYKQKLQHLRQYDQWISKQIFEDTLNVWDNEKEVKQVQVNFNQLESWLEQKIEETEKNMQKAQVIIMMQKRIIHYLEEHSMLLNFLPIRVPLPKNKYTLVSGFGKRIHPIFKILKQHNGIDFSARVGTPVLATAAGRVIPSTEKLIGYGNVVCIDHGNGYLTLYAQLLETKVKVNQQVNVNDTIGLVGNSGISYGPHLHYEIWYKGKPIDPIDLLLSVPPKAYFQMYKTAKQLNRSLS